MTIESQARYDAVAVAYVDMHPDVYREEPDRTLLDLAEPIADRHLLDLACGHGKVARELARRGASVVGVDISQALLAEAHLMEAREPLGVQYVQADVSSAFVVEEGFDGVVSSFGLSDIDDLDGALTTVARVLRPGGVFVFSILHPCFPGSLPNVSASWPPGRGYFAQGWWASDATLSTLRQKVGANHRTVSTYVNALTRHGLVIEQLAEPEPSQRWVDTTGLQEPVPVYLVVRCRAATAAA